MFGCTWSASGLEVPVYFLIGRHDVIAVTQLTEHYYHVLQAPHKELLWFDVDHGGISSNQLADVQVNRVLRQV